MASEKETTTVQVYENQIERSGDAPALNRGAQGAGGQPLPIEILSDLVNAREELEEIYSTVKKAMAYTQNNDALYTTLEEARKLLINVIQLMNQAIDLAKVR